jgi:hypothetical protein
MIRDKVNQSPLNLFLGCGWIGKTAWIPHGSGIACAAAVVMNPGDMAEAAAGDGSSLVFFNS